MTTRDLPIGYWGTFKETYLDKRFELIEAALTGLCGNPEFWDNHYETVAAAAVNIADSVLVEMENRGKEEQK